MSNKIRRLLHINLFDKITMKEDVLDIQLKKGPMLYSSHRKKQANRDNLRYRRKSIIIVRAIWLSLPRGNQTGLKPINLAIRSHIHCINPTTIIGRLSRRKSDKVSCAIGVKNIYFLSHCLFPARMRESLTIAFRGGDRRQGGNKDKVR